MSNPVLVLRNLAMAMLNKVPLKYTSFPSGNSKLHLPPVIFQDYYKRIELTVVINTKMQILPLIRVLKVLDGLDVSPRMIN